MSPIQTLHVWLCHVIMSTVHSSPTWKSTFPRSPQTDPVNTLSNFDTRSLPAFLLPWQQHHVYALGRWVKLVFVGQSTKEEVFMNSSWYQLVSQYVMLVKMYINTRDKLEYDHCNKKVNLLIIPWSFLCNALWWTMFSVCKLEQTVEFIITRIA